MLVRVVVISVAVAMVYAEKNATVTSNSSPLVTGMRPFFNMMNNFLDIVQPYAKGTLMDLVLGTTK
jgi:glucan phosphoethanolaminetransferase (alkaline phosphatase superfamily)